MAPAPRIVITVVEPEHRHEPLLGYRVFTGEAAGRVYVVRMQGETEAELHARALAQLDDKDGEGMLTRVVTEIRRR